MIFSPEFTLREGNREEKQQNYESQNKPIIPIGNKEQIDKKIIEKDSSGKDIDKSKSDKESLVYKNEKN